jgi:hypothetical protein
LQDHTWHGTLRTQDLKPEVRAARDALADAAWSGEWQQVLDLIDSLTWLTPNQWRPGGTSWYTPLHQAAWHGADRWVVEAMVERGGWLTLRTADGQTPQEIAVSNGHTAVADALTPHVAKEVEPDTLARLDWHLTDLIQSRIPPQLRVELRYPTVEVLTEIGEGRLWFPGPGVEGGFAIELLRSYLFVTSWSRDPGESGQAHVVTAKGFTLVEEGYV